MTGMDAMTFLERLDKATIQPVYVLHGDEEFLKRQALRGIRRLVLGENDDGFAVSGYPGDKAEWSTVVGDLQTLPFLAPHRLVVIEQADPFVSANREKLEKWFKEAASKPKVAGVLVLEVNTWVGTTRLAKLTNDAWLLTCKTPGGQQLPNWCIDWCSSQYGKQLSQPAARLLVELIGPQMGLLDKELEKLSTYVGEAARIDTRDVDELVGRCRHENTFALFDLIGAGKTGEALTLIQRLLEQGEEPMKLLGAFSWQLRSLARTARLNVQGVPLQEAMTQAGIRNYPAARQSVEQQLRHLGRRRLDRLYDWLLETDLLMKSTDAPDPSLLLERLVVRLARSRTST